MIGMWFTYRLDSKCLKESVRSFRKVFPSGVVCICDDSNNPVSKEEIADIAPDTYELRSWDSRGNMNGWPVVRGMLDFQLRMHDLHPGHDGALKIDSDTLILDDSWIIKDSPISGFSLGTQTIFAGMIRYLRADVPKQLLDYLKERWLWEGTKVPEDVAIGSYCALMYGKDCNSLDWTKGAKSYSYVNPDTNSRPCKVITFGNRKEISGMDDAQKRNFAGEEMEKYNDKN